MLPVQPFQHKVRALCAPVDLTGPVSCWSSAVLQLHNSPALPCLASAGHRSHISGHPSKPFLTWILISGLAHIPAYKDVAGVSALSISWYLVLPDYLYALFPSNFPNNSFCQPLPWRMDNLQRQMHLHCSSSSVSGIKQWTRGNRGGRWGERRTCILMKLGSMGTQWKYATCVWFPAWTPFSGVAGQCMYVHELVHLSSLFSDKKYLDGKLLQLPICC